MLLRLVSHDTFADLGGIEIFSLGRRIPEE